MKRQGDSFEKKNKVAEINLLDFQDIICVCAQPCLTLCNPMDCCPSGSSVHGISQARIPEWIAIFFSRGSSWPRESPTSLALQMDSLLLEPSGKPNQTSMGCKTESVNRKTQLHSPLSPPEDGRYFKLDAEESIYQRAQACLRFFILQENYCPEHNTVRAQRVPGFIC